MSEGLYSGVSGLALGTGLYKDTSGLWSGASGLIDGFGFGNPTLNLNFLPMSTLPSTVTFSRTTQATLTDSTGRLTYAPNNLATNSESFEAASWAKTGTTAAANTAVAPDGTSTADTATAVAGASQHFFTGNSAGAQNSSLVGSIYFKAGTHNFVQLFFGGSATPFANFNLALGTSSAFGAGTSANIVAVGNGWYRCSVFSNILSLSSLQFALVTSLSAARAESWTAAGTETVLVWGAQLEAVTYQTTPGTYNSTTPKNLLGFTQEFDNAAWTKSNSFVQTNLLPWSEQFDNGAWAKGTGVTVTANAETAPNGTITADNIAFSAGGAAQFVRGNPTLTVGVVYTVSVFARLVSGTPTFTFDVGNGASVSPARTPTSSWQRFTFTFTFSGANSWVDLEASAAGTIAFWGAQLVQGATAGDYQPTAAAAAPVQYVAPDGTLSAEKVVSTATSAVHRVQQVSTVVTATPYSASVYVKAAGYSRVGIREDNVTGSFATFNLATGTVIAQSAAGVGSITPVGDGWFRIAMNSASGGATFNLTVTVLDDGYTSGSPSLYTYTGNGTDGLLLWGAQLSNSASLDPYVYNPAAAPSSTAFYGPRFDFDPVTRAPRGILIEEQRTNIVTYSDQFDNSAWTKTRCQIVANVDPAAATFGPELGDAALLNIRPATGGTVTRSGGIITFAAPASGLSTSISQEITVTPGRLYRLRGRMRFVSGTLGGQAIQIRTASGGGGSETGSVFYTGGSSFQTLDLYFVPTVSPVFATFLAINGSTIEVEEASYSVRELIGGGLIAPDGTSTADTLVEDYTTSTHPVSAAVTLTAAAHTMAFYVKASGRSWTQLNLLGTANAFANFNVSTGTLGTVGAAATATITPVGNGWYRCTMTATTGAGANTVAIYPASADNTVSYTGTGIPSLFLWGAQLEAGAFATSYIPTVASQVTRTADVASMLGANFSSWYRQDEGTFVVGADTADANTANRSIYWASNAGNTDIVYGVAGTLRTLRVLVGGVETAGLNAGVFTSNVPAKTAGAYKVNDFAAAFNGGAVATDTSGAVPAGIDRLAIGAATTFSAVNYLNGHVRSLAYYPTRLTDAQLQAITA